MIISHVTHICCQGSNQVHCNHATRRDVTLVLDCVAGITLLVIGILFALGTISLNPAAGWAILGAGSVYTAIMMLELWKRTNIHCC